MVPTVCLGLAGGPKARDGPHVFAQGKGGSPPGNSARFLGLPREHIVKGIPGLLFNNAQAALSLSFRSCGQAAVPSYSLSTTTERK